MTLTRNVVFERFYILTEELIMNQVCHGFTFCQLVSSYWQFVGA